MTDTTSALASGANRTRLFEGLPLDRTMGVAVCRVGIGVAHVLFYVGNFNVRGFLWGQDSTESLASFQQRLLESHGFSLYAYASGEQFDLLYLMGFSAAMLFIVRGGKILTWIHFAFIYSLYSRTPVLLDGGDNLVILTLPLLALTHNDLYLSVGSNSRRKQKISSTITHNVAVRLILFQVLCVYAVAGACKVASPEWRSGEAMYFISQVRDYGWLPLATSLFEHPLISTVASYATIVVQLGFVAGVLSGSAWRRELAVAAVAVMHIGIMLTMGLIGFGLIMMATDAVALRNDDYRSLPARPPLRRIIKQKPVRATL